MSTDIKVRVDFICVHNAGRSQMAAAFAERECAYRDLEDVVEVHSGGTDPKEEVHDEVVHAMSEVGIDLSDRTPKYVPDLEQLRESDYLVTMGCSISKFNPGSYGVKSYTWDLRNPDGEDPETVRRVRDEIESRVNELFDEIEPMVENERVGSAASESLLTTLRDALPF